MPDSRYDVAIVGGGAIGSSIAYFLARDPGFKGKVAVIERDPTYRTASSALSASGIRQQFTTQVNIEIGRFGFEFLRQAGTFLEADGIVPEIGLVERGYLYLGAPFHEQQMREINKFQRDSHSEIELLGSNALKARFPWLNTDDLAVGSLGLKGEGWYDGYGLLQAYRRKARSLGVIFVHGEVVAVERSGKAVTSIRLADGSHIACGALVNAAGPRARLVAEMAGLTIPVEARCRSVFVFECKTELPHCPLVIDISGIWFRPEGPRFIAGVPPRDEQDAETFELNVDHGLFEDVLWPTLAARVPAFEAIKQTGSWAGHYEYNTLDQNGILGTHPDLPNMFFANGFSGHGLQQSPAVGRGIAELIVCGGYKSLDLSPLSINRIVENRPYREINII